MIPISALPQNTTSDWQAALRDAIRDPDELFALLALPRSQLEEAKNAAKDFRLLAPRGYVARMRAGDPRDPLLLQILPRGRELDPIAGFVTDPVGDLAAETVPGVLHKYHGRVLLVATGACAVHCRYCFRRHFPYGDSNPARNAWREAIAYLDSHTEVNEVILSGGDPLLLDDDKLANLLGELERIPHLRRLRLHTRMPVVLPERINAALLTWTRHTRLQIVYVIHANHANELDESVAQALGLLRGAGVHLLNQSVLLRGINDNVQTLECLSQRLFACGVLPYYLHLLDPVDGAAHFHVDDCEALAVMERLRARLPGYLVPRLVREEPGARAKTPVP